MNMMVIDTVASVIWYSKKHAHLVAYWNLKDHPSSASVGISLNVCLSVCHILKLYQNDYRHYWLEAFLDPDLEGGLDPDLEGGFDPDFSHTRCWRKTALYQMTEIVFFNPK